jgi:hypothetical protein
LLLNNEQYRLAAALACLEAHAAMKTHLLQDPTSSRSVNKFVSTRSPSQQPVTVLWVVGTVCVHNLRWSSGMRNCAACWLCQGSVGGLSPPELLVKLYVAVIGCRWLVAAA